MNKKATRLFSMLLAVLMVVTMIPVMALSAQEVAVVNETDPVVWDGKVPASSDGTVATVEEWIFGTGAAEGKTYDFNWSADYADFGEQFAQYEHIEYNGTDTITIKTAAGLALFTVWSNVNTTTVQGMGTSFGNGAGMTHPLVFLQGKTVKLAADLYLNDPAVDPAEWTNEVMPILWDNLDLFNADHRTSFTFDGCGYMIYGWNLNTSIVYDATNCQNFGWGLFGQLPGTGDGVTVKNVAMIEQRINLSYQTLTPASTVLDVEGTVEDTLASASDATKGLCTTWVGGIYGFALGKVNVYDCVIDVVSVVNGQGNGNFGSGSRSCTSCNFSAVGALHSNPTVYKELVAADNTGATVTDNSNAGRRDFKNLLISCESTLNHENVTWAGYGYNAVLGIQGWNNTAKLNDILIIKAVVTGGSENGVTTLKGNTHTGCYGLVAPATGEWLDDASNKAVQLPDAIAAFDTAVKTEVADVRTTFDTWTWTKDTVPMPIEFAAAKFIDSQFNNIFKIATPEDMMEWAANASKISAVSLVADIDMAGYDWAPIPEWSGVFDGNGHVIYNLTSTAQGDYYGSYNEPQNMRGGLVNKLTASSVFKNVAFLNMTFNCGGYWASVHAGMLVGCYSSCELTVNNVVISGRNDGKSAVYMGMFGGRANASAKAYINDCAFICTDPATSKFLGNFAGGAKDAWGTNSDVYVTNFYGVNVPAERTLSFCGNSSSAGRFTTLTNGYMTGAQDYTYFVSTTSAEFDTPWTYKSSSEDATAFYEALGEADVKKSDMLGSAMKLGEGWTYADGKLPVPKCFGADVATLLTDTNGIKADKASDFLTSVGASIRLGTGAEKQGIRFSFEVKAAMDLLAKNADVVYGVAVLPTALLGEDGVLNEDDAKMLLFANVGDGENTIQLDVVDGKFNAALVNFAGVTEGDAFGVEFTVRGIVVVNGEALWLDSYACSATDVAKAYIEANAGSEDATVLATIALIEEIYGDRLA